MAVDHSEAGSVSIRGIESSGGITGGGDWIRRSGGGIEGSNIGGGGRSAGGCKGGIPGADSVV